MVYQLYSTYKRSFQMNGTISWKELIAKGKVKFGEMRKTSYNFVIGLLLEGRHSVEQLEV
uniref:Uncharacterized protein n=1 Tax=Arundo donax TaxID=35708 RepID=A0A0A8Y885_ARUDO